MDERKFQQALANPQNPGEMTAADAVGTVGNPDCGDVLRMWIKFKEENGRNVIDRASFQSLGCQTAIAVASMATELRRVKSVGETRQLHAASLVGDLVPLPPMKIHCGQPVEGPLRSALGQAPAPAPGAGSDSTLSASLHRAAPSGKVRFIPLEHDAG